MKELNSNNETKRRNEIMKYMFASDVHGSAYYCRKMLDAYREEKAERLVLLGDLLYQDQEMIFRKIMHLRK